MIDIGISDDYAVLETDEYTFYYGYEHVNDDDEWMFVVRANDIDGNNLLFSRSQSQIEELTDRLYSTSEYLLIGIALFLETL